MKPKQIKSQMTKAEKLELLRRWLERMKKADAIVVKLSGLIGSSTEGPLKMAIFDLQYGYTRAVSLAIEDHHEWCEWWAFDNDMGKRGLQAGATATTTRQVKTMAQLLTLIEASNAKG